MEKETALTKQCRSCGSIKTLDFYHRDKSSKDGRFYVCKDCAHEIAVTVYAKKSLSPEWMEKERIRALDRYERLRKNKQKSKNRVAQLTDHARKFRSKFPEKYKAAIAIGKMKRPKGYHLHHWSYNKEHYKDVILLTTRNHGKAHRHLVYDLKAKMYRSLDGDILDTREKHINYLNSIINVQTFGK